MTSKERKEARYQRRQAQRTEKMTASNKSFEEVFSFENLVDAGLKCCNGARWKTSVINFENNLLKEVAEVYRELFSGEHSFRGFNSFETWEHGKRREINALHIRDRVRQKCLCRNFLVECVSRTFITDNGACLPGKGKSFQLDRMKKHLTDHYRKHGLAGGILQFDFKGYFGSIPHDKIKEHMRRYIADDQIYSLFCHLVDDYKYLSTYDDRDGIARGIGLGSEISQIIGLEYASALDHFFKDKMGIHGYGRYNDDGYIIHESFAYLKELRDMLIQETEKLGLQLNPKKIKITPFKNHGFSFLKVRFQMSETGHISMRVNRKSIKVQRRKMKKFRKWVTEGSLDFEDVACSYQSWRAYVRSIGNSYNTLHHADKWFIENFAEELRIRDKRFPCTFKAVLKEDGWYYEKVNHPSYPSSPSL